MQTEQQIYKTSFGQYVPLSYEDYKKLKVIKSSLNVSSLKALRYSKWGYKLPHNRTDNEPELCEVFHSKFDMVEKVTQYNIWDSASRTFGVLERQVSDFKNVGPIGKVRAAWDAAKPKKKKKDVEPIDFGFDLDVLYEACLPFYNKYCKRDVQ